MKRINFILIIIAGYYFSIGNSSAQTRTNIDTVYYLIDTASTPTRERILKFSYEGDYNFYVFNCYCYAKQANAFFGYPTKVKGSEISKTRFNLLKMTSLPALLKMINEYGNDRIKKHEFIFIEPSKTGYIGRRTTLNGPDHYQQIN